jgi:hypothetical protein
MGHGGPVALQALSRQVLLQGVHQELVRTISMTSIQAVVVVEFHLERLRVSKLVQEELFDDVCGRRVSHAGKDRLPRGEEALQVPVVL